MIDTTIVRLEQDITYFTNIGCTQLADKFRQDLECINYLQNQLNKTTQEGNNNQ